MFLDEYGYHISLMWMLDSTHYDGIDFDGPLTESILDVMWRVGINGVLTKHSDVIFLFDTMVNEGSEEITCLVNEQYQDIHMSDDKAFFLDGSPNKEFCLRDVFKKMKALYPEILGDMCL